MYMYIYLYIPIYIYTHICIYAHTVIEGVACIRDVAFAHPGFAAYLACIRCPKVCCVYPSKLHFYFRASVPKKTLARIRFQSH